ncbi:MAG: TIGR01777 family oxidoreductase [Bacteroidetes bacterium]|nr:TIGR01777 family oxidoreductase [Bacteroidota bacterium]
MKKVLITGGSGLLGRSITHLLLKSGFQVAWLTRKENGSMPIKHFVWDVDKGEIDAEAIQFADVIVHLAGAGIADKPWTPTRKKEIIDSRVKATNLLVSAIKAGGRSPELVVAASAVGYYGAVTELPVFSENDPPASDFLGNTTRLWEEATNQFRELGIKTIQFRIGVVLAANGGALPKMMTPVKFGLGAALGSGRQWMPWIHVDDLSRMFLYPMLNDLSDGVYNAVSPAHNNNKQFMKMLAKVLKRPYFLPPIPGFVMKMALGEMADMVLYGSLVSSDKIQKAGFSFAFTDLEPALEDLVTKQKHLSDTD